MVALTDWIQYNTLLYAEGNLPVNIARQGAMWYLKKSKHSRVSSRKILSSKQLVIQTAPSICTYHVDPSGILKTV